MLLFLEPIAIVVAQHCPYLLHFVSALLLIENPHLLNLFLEALVLFVQFADAECDELNVLASLLKLPKLLAFVGQFFLEGFNSLLGLL